MRHVLYVTGTRADYGLMRRTLAAISSYPELRLSVGATGMHLMPEFGETVSEIDIAGCDLHTVDATLDADTKEAMASYTGKCLTGCTALLRKLEPDLLLVLGDRGEMLAAAIAAVYLGIPVAHIHGGDLSSTVDDLIRHSITKLASIHFPATATSAKRLQAMGEDSGRIHVVGAPGLDGITDGLLSRSDLVAALGLPTGQQIALVLQHPVSAEAGQAAEQMRATLDAVAALELVQVVVYPNADAGGRAMISVIEEYARQNKVKAFKSLPRHLFLSLMHHAAVMVGNSSAGIIESASFRLPAVNIGSRQTGREHGWNVLDAPHDPAQLLEMLKLAISPVFAEQLADLVSPYGDGTAGTRIAEHLAKLDPTLLVTQKRLAT